MADHIDALQNIRLGIEMDRHCLDDADERLAALDAAIAALAQQAGAHVPCPGCGVAGDDFTCMRCGQFVKLHSSAPGGGGEGA